jgi:hypothetical protein
MYYDYVIKDGWGWDLSVFLTVDFSGGRISRVVSLYTAITGWHPGISKSDKAKPSYSYYSSRRALYLYVNVAIYRYVPYLKVHYYTSIYRKSIPTGRLV